MPKLNEEQLDTVYIALSRYAREALADNDTAQATEAAKLRDLFRELREDVKEGPYAKEVRLEVALVE